MCFPCQHCLGSRLLCQELSEAGSGLCALSRSKPLRFRYLGSPQRYRLGWACVLCPSLIRASQVTKCLTSMVAATYRTPIPATRFSGCTTSTPSQADVDRPESQEVLATKPACSLVDNASLGPRLPLCSSGCLSLEGYGLQSASSAQSFVL